MMAELPDDREIIGKRLKQLRFALGYGKDQGGFARLCGISHNALSNYENGNRRPNLEQIARIYNRTGATYEWLFLGDERMLSVELRRLLREAETDDNNNVRRVPSR